MNKPCLPGCLPQIKAYTGCTETAEVKVCCVRLQIVISCSEPVSAGTYEFTGPDCDATTQSGLNTSGSLLFTATSNSESKTAVQLRICTIQAGEGLGSLGGPDRMHLAWTYECATGIVRFYVFLVWPDYANPWMLGYLETDREWYLTSPLTIPLATTSNQPGSGLGPGIIPRFPYYLLGEATIDGQPEGDPGTISSITVTQDCATVTNCEPYTCFPLCVANTCPEDPETVNYSLLFWHLECNGSTGEHSGQFDPPSGGSGGTYQAGDWPFGGLPQISCIDGVPTLSGVTIFGVTFDPVPMVPFECSDGEASWVSGEVFTDPAGPGSGGGAAELCVLTIFTNNGGAL